MRATGQKLRERALAALVLAVAGCAGVKANGGSGGRGGEGGVAGLGDAGATGAAGSSAFADGAPAGGAGGGDGGTAFGECMAACADFPVEPLVEPGAPRDAPTMFSIAPAGLGPCITEPEDGALFPGNWLRPRVKFRPAVPGTLHEIRLHADQEANDLVAYTTSDTWTMPKTIWSALASRVTEEPITVTVRALGGGASTVKFFIAPVAASGSIVYWAADPAELGTKQSMTSTLEGFGVGDDKTTTALRVSDVQMQTRLGNNALRPVKCIGCHNSTPDGKSVGFIDLYPWNMAIAGVEPGRTGLVPAEISPGGIDTIRQPGMGIFSFSKAYWNKDSRLAVSPYYLDEPCSPYSQRKANVRLAWLNLLAPPVTGGCPVEGKHFGIIARNGDPRGAANPTWSRDGTVIVYSSTAIGQDGRLDIGPSDLYEVPFNKGMGGDASPLPGASEPGFDEYYPAFSPDGKLVVFDRIPVGGVMYANPLAELYVVRADGTSATATRLPANDPPACSGAVSPGVNNHWAKWAPPPPPPQGKQTVDDPRPASANGKDYYWLIFSSNRAGIPPVSAGGSLVQVSQLYATAIVVSETSMQMYPAIYLWNQRTDRLNTTPAWDAFSLPVIP